ncbi:MAG: hypothetical protein R2839_00490 [Thermomicrobiales bacterium]
MGDRGLALIVGLLITDSAVLLWKELEISRIQRAGGILLAVARAALYPGQHRSLSIRRHMTATGSPLPLPLALLTAAIVLLCQSLIDIWPPVEDFRDALPVIAVDHRTQLWRVTS